MPELRKLVSEDGDHGLGGGELGPEAKGEQHQEEEDAPERRDGHPGHGLGVGDEGQASALGSHVSNLETKKDYWSLEQKELRLKDQCLPPPPTHEP